MSSTFNLLSFTNSITIVKLILSVIQWEGQYAVVVINAYLSMFSIHYNSPEHPGWKIDNFKVPIAMPTYLFAVVVSDFTYSEADSAIFPGKTIRVREQLTLTHD